MTRLDLIAKWRESFTGFGSAAQAEAAYAQLCDVMAAELVSGGEVPLPGVGKLTVKETAARKGRNPKTGAVIDIPVGKKVVLRASKELKDSLQ